MMKVKVKDVEGDDKIIKMLSIRDEFSSNIKYTMHFNTNIT